MSKLDQLLDDYYAPIKIPDNNREGLKKELKQIYQKYIDEVLGEPYPIAEDDKPQVVAAIKLVNALLDDMRQHAKKLVEEL